MVSEVGGQKKKQILYTSPSQFHFPLHFFCLKIQFHVSHFQTGNKKQAVYK